MAPSQRSEAPRTEALLVRVLAGTDRRSGRTKCSVISGIPLAFDGLATVILSHALW
jgi:hypothetical protein